MTQEPATFKVKYGVSKSAGVEVIQSRCSVGEMLENLLLLLFLVGTREY
jgi:hypothetical protein